MKTILNYFVLLAIFILPGCNAYSYIISGYSHFAEENYELALADYNKAIKINPKIYGVYFNRAALYKKQKKYDLALADYGKVIELYPQIHFTYFHRAELYKQQKEYDLALADINKAIELNPSSIYYQRRGSVYYMKKQYDSAVKEYVKAIRLNNNYTVAYNSLAWLFATCSDEKYRNGLKAIEYAKKAIDLDPESQMFDTLAAAYAEAGDFDMAVKNQEKAIELLKEEGRSDNLDGFEKRLESYKRDIPWRDIY